MIDVASPWEYKKKVGSQPAFLLDEDLGVTPLS